MPPASDVAALDFPFHFDARGRSARASGDDHVRDLIELVLFTTPGERVNRPDFGCGLKQLVFAPASDALAAATQQLVHGALLQWLGNVITTRSVDVAVDDATLSVTVVYARIDTGERRTDQFSRPLPTT